MNRTLTVIAPDCTMWNKSITSLSKEKLEALVFDLRTRVVVFFWVWGSLELGFVFAIIAKVLSVENCKRKS